MSLTIDRSLRLPESEYFPQQHEKTGIAIHHTVGPSARSAFDWWLKHRRNGGRPEMVGTAYIIETDGTVYEVFDPSAWAYQFGLDWTPATKLKFEQRFIGIELVSEGGLIESDGELYCYDKVSPRTKKPRDEAFDFGGEYRGYRWFDKYSSAQRHALSDLVDSLCSRFPIPRRRPEHPFDFYGDALMHFEGVIGHAMVRADKSDPAPDKRMWNVLQNEAHVWPVAVERAVRKRTRVLGSQQVEALFADNLRVVHEMRVPAGSLVKALLMELERRGTYVRLAEPELTGHAVHYEFLQGDRSLIGRIGRALHFHKITDELLELTHG